MFCMHTPVADERRRLNGHVPRVPPLWAPRSGVTDEGTNAPLAAQMWAPFK